MKKFNKRDYASKEEFAELLKLSPYKMQLLFKKCGMRIPTFKCGVSGKKWYVRSEVNEFVKRVIILDDDIRTLKTSWFDQLETRYFNTMAQRFIRGDFRPQDEAY